MSSEAPILLVEDNPDDVTLTLRAFAKNNVGNEVVVAADGEAALVYLLPEDRTEPLRPAVILLDLNMPKMSGLEVLQRIRADKRTHLLPVVVLTTSNEERDVVESYQLGANSFIRKPVVFPEFVEAVRLLGMYWVLLNLMPPPIEHGP